MHEGELMQKHVHFDPSISSSGQFLFCPLANESASLNILPYYYFLKSHPISKSLPHSKLEIFKKNTQRFG